MRLTLSVSIALAAAGVAHADESSITLYGTIDTGLTYLSNQQVVSAAGVSSGHSIVALTGANFWPSNFGLLGTEDLGGGNAAVFELRNYFSSTTGAQYQPSRLFGVAKVGLKSDTYGSLMLGRQYDSYTDMLSPIAASNAFAGGYAAHFGDVDNLNLDFSVSNAIKYTSPVLFGGLTIGGTFAPGGVAGNFSENLAWAIATSYVAGPINVAAGFLSVRNPYTSVYGGDSDYLGGLSCSTATSYCNIFRSDELRTFGVGGSYDFGPAVVGAVLTSARHLGSQYGLALDGRVEDIRFDTAEINALYKLSPDLSLGVAYAYTHVKTDADTTSGIHKVSFAVDYNITKRTLLYTFVNYEYMHGRFGIDPAGSPASYAQLPYFSNAAGPSQAAVTAGIRHSF
ncbi:porin [Paraburkholderia tropica]|uniref:porin n=1 Tax=Paraburkholderia tropica TaxID=92647 RepID=UPI002AB7044B|nr:porin [Paraburkholderia tropica]